MSSAENSAKMKHAASLLVKGGTLTGEPCENCQGVLIRFGNKITCINCGKEKEILPVPSSVESKDDSTKQLVPALNLDVCAKAVEKKISQLALEIESEDVILIQKQKAELLETYLRILEKVRSMRS